MALAQLRAAAIPWTEDLPCVLACPPEERRLLAQQLERNLNCVPTSSMGRLFDAVSSLAGVCHLAGYEAQAAVELEAAALTAGVLSGSGYAFPLRPSGPAGTGAELLADPGPLLAAVVDDLRREVLPAVIAARFHAAVAELVHRICLSARERYGLDTVALTGGVFANTLLSSSCAAALAQDGFTVLRHHRVPPNDGGLALGQLIVAARPDA
jgi:hydrogenase maturation protein HypF